MMDDTVLPALSGDFGQLPRTVGPQGGGPFLSTDYNYGNAGLGSDSQSEATSSPHSSYPSSTSDYYGSDSTHRRLHVSSLAVAQSLQSLLDNLQELARAHPELLVRVAVGVSSVASGVCTNDTTARQLLQVMFSDVPSLLEQVSSRAGSPHPSSDGEHIVNGTSSDSAKVDLVRLVARPPVEAPALVLLVELWEAEAILSRMSWAHILHLTNGVLPPGTGDTQLHFLSSVQHHLSSLDVHTLSEHSDRVASTEPHFQRARLLELQPHVLPEILHFVLEVLKLQPSELADFHSWFARTEPTQLACLAALLGSVQPFEVVQLKQAFDAAPSRLSPADIRAAARSAAPTDIGADLRRIGFGAQPQFSSSIDDLGVDLSTHDFAAEFDSSEVDISLFGMIPDLGGDTGAATFGFPNRALFSAGSWGVELEPHRVGLQLFTGFESDQSHLQPLTSNFGDRAPHVVHLAPLPPRHEGDGDQLLGIHGSHAQNSADHGDFFRISHDLAPSRFLSAHGDPDSSAPKQVVVKTEPGLQQAGLSMTVAGTADSAVPIGPVSELNLQLRVVRQPPPRTVYQRILKPFPSVMLVGTDATNSNLFVEAQLVRTDTAGELPLCMEGNRIVRITNGMFAVFKKLKILSTSQQQGCDFKLRFTLKRYAANIFEEIPSATTSTNPIEVFSHTLYLQEKPEAPPPPPILNEILPSVGRPGVRCAVIGSNFVKSKTLTVRFGATVAATPLWHEQGTLVVSVPTLSQQDITAAGGKSEITVAVQVSNDGVIYCNTHAVFTFSTLNPVS